VHNDRILTFSLLCYAALVTLRVNDALEMKFMNYELARALTTIAQKWIIYYVVKSFIAP